MSQLPSLADAPNTLREYETIYILRPNTANEGVAEVNTRVRGIIDNMGGKIIKVDNWGKRRLAYEIEKERKGIYLYWQYLASQGVVEEIERNMRMLDPVIRYLTVKLGSDVASEERPTELTDETFERAANTAADEEDLFLGRTGDEDSEDSDYDDDYDEDDQFPGSSRPPSRAASRAPEPIGAAAPEAAVAAAPEAAAAAAPEGAPEAVVAAAPEAVVATDPEPAAASDLDKDEE